MEELTSTRTVTLSVLQGRGLPVCDSNGKSDPYVKGTYAVAAEGSNAHSSKRASLMKLAKPKEKRSFWKGKTKVCPKTLEPVWNESFELGAFVPAAKLRLECWDKDKLTADDFMGACDVDVASLADGGRRRAWLPLQPKASKSHTTAGEIEVEIIVSGAKCMEASDGNALKPTPSTANKIFGVSLEEMLKLRKSPVEGVPYLLWALVRTLRSRGGTQQTGIFRVAGKKAQMDDCIAYLNAHEAEKWDMSALQLPVHTFSGVLKQLVRQLPSPLLSKTLHDAVISNGGSDDGMAGLVELLKREPEIRLACFHHIVTLLLDIRDNSAFTQMDAQNLAIVWAPNLLWVPEEDGPPSVDALLKYRSALAHVTSFVQGILSDYNSFFPDQAKAREAAATPGSNPPAIDVDSVRKGRGRTRNVCADSASSRVIAIKDMDPSMLFVSYDDDQSNYLDATEFYIFYKDLLEALGREVTNVELANALNAIDTDGNGQVELDEFLTWWNANKDTVLALDAQ